MEPFVSVAKLPDTGAAQSLKEVLLAGGIEPVEIVARTGVAYLPRATILEHEVRVPASQAERANRLIAAHLEEAADAADRVWDQIEAEREPGESSDASAPSAPLRRSYVRLVAFLLALLLLVPLLLRFVTGLVAGPDAPSIIE